MKKIPFLFLSVALALSLCACGSSANTSTTDDQVEEAVTEDSNASEEGIHYSIGDTVTTDNWEYTLTYVEFSNAITAVSSASSSTSDYYYLPANTEYKRSGAGDWINADSGQIYLTFQFSVKYIGSESLTADPPSLVSMVYDETYTFSTTSVSLLKDDGSWSHTFYEFEPLSSSVSGRGYIEGISETVISDTDTVIQLVVNVYGTEYTYEFSVADAVIDDTSAYADTNLTDMVAEFGDEDGKISWSEGAFPYFIDMRETWSLLTEDEITSQIEGDWSIKEYTSKPDSEKIYTFAADGLGSYTGSLREYTVYWVAKDGVLYFDTKEISTDISEITIYEIREAAEGVWVLYNADEHPVIVMTKQ